MFYLSIFLIIVSIILFIIGYKNLTLAKQIKNTKEQDLIQTKEKIHQAQQEINNLYYEKTKLLEDITKEKQNLAVNYENEKNKISEQIKLYKDNTSYASEQYLHTLELSYEKAELDYDIKMQNLITEKELCEKELNKMREALSAGVQANLREMEKEQNLQFYKLSISDKDLEDVMKLETVKLSLHQPVILSKLIWSTYFQKQTTEMCNRILGTKKICGIYKITNLKTQQCYIGQSVDVAQRWKDHCKCGLGIEASATNKLYNAMQKDGIWNFSFELMEECPREQLNEKEKFWIELYQSNIYSYNSTKGNK